jgi:HAMP domain-containing protein
MKVVRAVVVFRGLALAGLLVLTACAQAPSQEMSDARRAVAGALSADPHARVANGLARAQSSLRAAGESLEVGDYAIAREQAIAAKRIAVGVHQLAKALQDLEVAMSKARAQGREVSGARRMAESALRAAHAGDLERASQLAHGARRLLLP